MDRRAFIATVSLSSVVAWLKTDAKAAPQARVAWLMPAAVPSDLEYFRRGLRDLGWTEGERLIIEQRYADGKPERLPQLAADLARLKVDVFVTAGSQATDAARGVPQSVPVVFVSTDPAGKGWIKSLSHPGGKLTGVSMQNDELHLKMLEVLHEAFPRIRRVGIFHAPTPWQLRFLREMQPAAQALSVQLVPLPVNSPDDIDRSSAVVAKERVGGLLTMSNPSFNAERRRFIDLAARLRLPAVYEHRDFVQAGGLLSYGPDLSEVFRRAAALVDKILKGVKPEDLPVEQPTKFELAINLKTARTVGLTIPQSLLVRADEIIQ